MKDYATSDLSTAIIAVYMSLKKLGPPTRGGGPSPHFFLDILSTLSCGAVYSALMLIAAYFATVCTAWITDIL